jgi:uncharacterized delta-60 repeat protein
VLLCCLGTAGGARAASPGTLNPGFGTGGLAHSGSATRLFGTAVQGDGKIVAVGESGVGTTLDVVLARYGPTGALDGSFGSGGIAHGPAIAGSPGSLARAVAIQPDGKIVIVGKATDGSGYARNGLLVERYNSNGGLDTTFGSAGVVNVAAPSYGDGYAVAIQPDGKIVATGTIDASGQGGVYPRVAVVRLNSNGSLDTGFAGGGTDVIDLGAFSYAQAVLIQPDGKIVIAGSQAPGLQVPNALIARLTPSGALDPSFPPYAHQYAIGAASSGFNALALQPDGAIVAAGAAASGQSGADAIVARFTTAGQPDGSFASGGVVHSTSAIGFNQTAQQSVPGATGVTLARNGDIVAAGAFINGQSSYATLWAFTSRGAPDPAFGNKGVSVLSAGGANETEAGGIAVSPATGILFAAGDVWTQFTDAFTGLVASYIGFGAPTPPPPPAFKLTLAGVSRTYKDATVAKQGLKLTTGCNQACTIKVALLASAATARRLHITTAVKQCKKVKGRRRCHTVHVYRALTISPQQASLRGAGSKTFVLRLSSSFVKALKTQRSVGLTLKVSGTVAKPKQTRVINTSVTFKR